MKHYDTAIKFERAADVLRQLVRAGKTPTVSDEQYVNELREKLDRIDQLTGDTWTLHWNGDGWVKMHPSKCPRCSDEHMVNSILCVDAAHL